MPRIAISYRRADSGVISGRIFDRLVAHYGRGAVFRDIDNIPLGIDFRQHVNAVLDESEIVLAIVGPRWVGTGERGNRLDDEADPVRVEIEAALRKGVPLIPALVLGASMPATVDLPNSLKDFAYRNAIQIDAGQDFDMHIERLIRAMDGMLHIPAKESTDGSPRTGGSATQYRRFGLVTPLRLTVTLVALAVIGVSAASWFFDGHNLRALKLRSPSTPVVAPQSASVPSTTPPAINKSNPLPPQADAEVVFWQSVAASNDPKDFNEYLSKYPDGRFAGLARNRLAALRSSPTANPPLPVSPPPAVTGKCGTSDEQIMRPVKLLYQAVNTKNIDLYAAQWAEGGRYTDVAKGITRSKAEKIEERRARFAAWEMVSLVMDRSTITERGVDRATVDVIYSMSIKTYGRPAGLGQTGVSEQYNLVCFDGRWLIQTNVDENR